MNRKALRYVRFTLNVNIRELQTLIEMHGDAGYEPDDLVPKLRFKYNNVAQTPDWGFEILNYELYYFFLVV